MPVSAEILFSEDFFSCFVFFGAGVVQHLTVFHSEIYCLSTPCVILYVEGPGKSWLKPHVEEQNICEAPPPHPNSWLLSKYNLSLNRSLEN